MTARRFTDEVALNIRQAYAGDESLTAKSLAQEHGVSTQMMCELISGRTYQHLPDAVEIRNPTGAGSKRIMPRSAILRLLESGFSPQEVANSVGCSQGYVRAVRHGKLPA